MKLTESDTGFFPLAVITTELTSVLYVMSSTALLAMWNSGSSIEI